MMTQQAVPMFGPVNAALSSTVVAEEDVQRAITGGCQPMQLFRRYLSKQERSVLLPQCLRDRKT